ncbi:MAG: aspartate aminotransferase family protein [Bacteroidetes bacterium]|nr:aspartate aminotransferase family protein [Bacteroidota bacterium]
MTNDEFRKHAHQLADWMADYYETIESLPVKPVGLKPGDIASRFPGTVPEEGDSFDSVFADFRDHLLPGMTHWQHPMFMAYFPANTSYPSVLAEMITATLGAQCMLWDTSPAATELETTVINWIRNWFGFPDEWEGVIQDSASSSTLAALIAAREKAESVNQNGFSGQRMVVYGTSQTHSSAEKAVRLAGIGSDGFRKVATNERYEMDPRALEEMVAEDRKAGKVPLAVVATIGTTGIMAVDPVDAIATICRRENLWLHVDAAYAGSLLALPEFGWMKTGLDRADSFVFNPHKWMLTNFDCSVLLVRDAEHLVHSLSVIPDYLRTPVHGTARNYSDWSVQLGRRFRSLKLWMVLRSYGASGIRSYLRGHLLLGKQIAEWVGSQPDFRVVMPVRFNLVPFRWEPSGVDRPEENDRLSEKLMNRVNGSGQLYFTHTRLEGRLILRLVPGQSRVSERHIVAACRLIRETANQILEEER